MAQTAPDGSPRVWVFADPYVQAGKHGVIQISKEITLYHGPLNGSGGWMELRDMFAWTGLEMEAAKPALHVPFTGGKRAKPREVELAMRRDDSPFVAIQAYEQAIQVEVCVRFKSGNNTVEHFSLSHRQAWAAAHEARTHRVFLDTRTGHFHKVRRVREPIAGNLQIVIDVRNKPMEEST